jgi:hypothetical protein
MCFSNLWRSRLSACVFEQTQLRRRSARPDALIACFFEASAPSNRRNVHWGSELHFANLRSGDMRDCTVGGGGGLVRSNKGGGIGTDQLKRDYSAVYHSFHKASARARARACARARARPRPPPHTCTYTNAPPAHTRTHAHTLAHTHPRPPARPPAHAHCCLWCCFRLCN